MLELRRVFTPLEPARTVMAAGKVKPVGPTFGTKVDDLIALSMKKPLRINVGRKSGSSSHKTSVEIAPRLEQEFVCTTSGGAVTFNTLAGNMTLGNFDTTNSGGNGALTLNSAGRKWRASKKP